MTNLVTGLWGCSFCMVVNITIEVPHQSHLTAPPLWGCSFSLPYCKMRRHIQITKPDPGTPAGGPIHRNIQGPSHDGHYGPGGQAEQSFKRTIPVDSLDLVHASNIFFSGILRGIVFYVFVLKTY